MATSFRCRWSWIWNNFFSTTNGSGVKPLSSGLFLSIYWHHLIHMSWIFVKALPINHPSGRQYLLLFCFCGLGLVWQIRLVSIFIFAMWMSMCGGRRLVNALIIIIIIIFVYLVIIPVLESWTWLAEGSYAGIFIFISSSTSFSVSLRSTATSTCD